jgi:PAS domain S-box-containing protein
VRKDRESILSGLQKPNSLRWVLNRPFARYAIAIIAVGAGLLVQETLNRALGKQLPTFILLYPPVLLVAVLAGLRPGLVATLLAVLDADYLFMSPVGHFAISSVSDLVSLTIFLAMGILVSLFAERYRQGERQKHTMEAHRQQSEMMNASFDAIMVVRPGKGVESWNRGAERLYGYSESDTLGRDPHELLNTSPATLWSWIIAILRQQDTWECELRQKTKDGREVIVATRYQLFAGVDGAELIVEIGRDITERKRAEETVRRSEAKYRTLVENIPQKILMKSRDCRWVSVNENLARDFGIRPEDVVGKVDYDLFPHELADKYHADDVRIMETGCTDEFDEEYMEGSEARIVHTIKTPVRDESGAVIGVLGVFWDVTERKRMEKDLLQSEERFRVAAQTTNDVVYEWDLKQSVQWFGGIDEMLGYEQGEFSRTLDGWAASLHPEDLERTMAEVQAHLDGGIPYAAEYRVRRKNGDYRWWSARGAATRAPDGKPTRWIGSITDITEHKQAELAIRKFNEELEELVRMRTLELESANKELETFSYSVSHDLRAPLRHLDGFLSLLTKRSYAMLDDQAKHYVDQTLEASRRMGQLIDDLLQFSRLGRAEIHKMPVDLNEIVEQVRKELEPEARDRQVVWKLGVLPNLPADEGMLRQVLENLIGNALKFTRQRPVAEIEIGSEPGPNGEVVIFVRDNGAGFDAQYYNKMFQIFQRLHSEREFEGTGIGLAIARRVVERHGGRIWAEGIVDKGAIYHFALPS